MPSETAPSTPAMSGVLDIDQARDLVNTRIDSLNTDLRTKINSVLHNNPELCFEEHIAHDTITSYLETLGFDVRKSAYDLATSFEATLGQGGREVVICAEYDALPGIGHGCGHNLIATSSVAAFLGAAQAMSTLKIPGRLRILGTPAEEGGGGKALLIDRGAFKDVSAAIMAHPLGHDSLQSGDSNYSGLAGLLFLSCYRFQVEFHGKGAHAAGEPWNGVNALDAAISAYNNAASLRQQIRPDERIHSIIEDGGSASNIIPDYARMLWGVRGPTINRAEELFQRVKKCIDAAALATGCSHNFIMAPIYMNLRANGTLCKHYVQDMAAIGEKVQLHQQKPYTASTDMGNVSHVVPTFHGAFAVPTEPGVALHTPKFAEAAATDGAHAAALKCGKGMAMLALRVLMDGQVADEALVDFKKPDPLDSE